MRDRIKATAACDACRLRKTKCSGVSPCDLCREYGFQCHINRVQRKRGPRPKGQAAQNTTISKRSATPPDSEVAVVGSSSESLVVAENRNRPAWQESLRSGSPDGNFKLSADLDIPVDLLIHLIQVLLEYINNREQILDEDEFLNDLAEGTRPLALINGVAALGFVYSRSNVLRHDVNDDTFGDELACQARHALFAYNLPIKSRIRCLYLLYLFELHRGRGPQAWIDLAASYGLFRLSGSRPVGHNIDDLASEAIELFVHRNMYVCALGMPALLHASAHPQMDNTTALPFLLLDHLRRIDELRVTVTVPDEMQPRSWLAHAEFCNLHHSLSEIAVIHHQETSWVAGKLTEAGAAAAFETHERLLTPLLWNLCFVRLLRVFLPIPGRQAQFDPMGGGAVVDGLDPTTVSLFNAPKEFIAEQINTCEVAATTLSNICAGIMGFKESLVSPIVLYACYQAAIVHINQLHRARQAVSPAVIEHLKTHFTILGTMQKSFALSRPWVTNLLALHSAHNAYRPFNLSPNQTLDTYFARFLNLEEVPFLGPLNKAGEQVAAQERPVEVSNLDLLQTTMLQQHQQQPTSVPESDWRHTYVGQVDGFL